MCGRSPLAYREITSHTSGEHLPRIRRSSAAHREVICHISRGYLLCIEIASVIHRQTIYHALKSYLPPIGNTVRKQPQRGWSVFIEKSSNSGDQNNPPHPPNLRGLNRPRPTALFSLFTSQTGQARFTRQPCSTNRPTATRQTACNPHSHYKRWFFAHRGMSVMHSQLLRIKGNRGKSKECTIWNNIIQHFLTILRVSKNEHQTAGVPLPNRNPSGKKQKGVTN